MPIITDILLDKSKKKFKKKDYRPWDVEVEKKTVEELKEKDNNLDFNEKEKKIIPKEYEKQLFLNSICGIQKNILLFMIKNIDIDDEEVFFTKAIYRSELAEFTKSNVGTVGTSVFRLQEKGVIKLHFYKKGKGAFSIFKIEKNIVSLFKK